MNEEENFLTIDALSSLINKKVKRIQKGNLKIQMLEQLLDEVKELQERLIIIKYKAMEKLANPPVEKNLFSAENFEPIQKEEQKQTLNFGFTKNPEKSEPQIVPENQISLIDSIEELSKEESLRNKNKHEESKKKEPQKEKKQDLTDNDHFKTVVQNDSKGGITFSDKISHETSEPKVKDKIVKTSPSGPKEIEKTVTKVNAKKSSKTTLSQKFSKTHIDSIPKAIKLNQRIGMVKKLFGGDDQLFKDEINRLDKASNLDEAVNLLDKVKNSRKWKEDDQWFLLLSQLVERRHS